MHKGPAAKGNGTEGRRCQAADGEGRYSQMRQFDMVNILDMIGRPEIGQFVINGAIKGEMHQARNPFPEFLPGVFLVHSAASESARALSSEA